jgi:hypothetical protein
MWTGSSYPRVYHLGLRHEDFNDPQIKPSEHGQQFNRTGKLPDRFSYSFMAHLPISCQKFFFQLFLLKYW